MPWVHYVPIQCDLADLELRVKWVLNDANSAAAQRIAHAGSKLMANVTIAAAVAHAAEGLHRHFHTFDRHPMLQRAARSQETLMAARLRSKYHHVTEAGAMMKLEKRS